MWGLGHALGARVRLRIEDHDAQRARPAYERALLDDLDWLGFVPDEFPTSAFRAGPCDSRQSDRQLVYDAAARDLIDRGVVYACDCSRQQIAAASSRAAGGADTEPRYPGTCRERRLPLDAETAWRVAIEARAEAFDDLLCGPQEQNPADRYGDVVIRDRLGNWTYQFVAAVDDYRQAIDLVVRGRDLLASTGRQMAIARLLGRTSQATFAHHPLVMKSATQKFSKSDCDTGVRDLRRAGWTPHQVIGEAARAATLLAESRAISAQEAPELFRSRLASFES